MVLTSLGIVCLSDFMTREDRAAGRLVPLFAGETLHVLQFINEVYYRNTARAARITYFVNYVVSVLGERPFGASVCGLPGVTATAPALCTCRSDSKCPPILPHDDLVRRHLPASVKSATPALTSRTPNTTFRHSAFFRAT